MSSHAPIHFAIACLLTASVVGCGQPGVTAGAARNDDTSAQVATSQAVAGALAGDEAQPVKLLLVMTSIPGEDAAVAKAATDALRASGVPGSSDAPVVTATAYGAHTVAGKADDAKTPGVSAVALRGPKLQVGIAEIANAADDHAAAGKALGQAVMNAQPDAKGIVLLGEHTVSHPWDVEKSGVIEDFLQAFRGEIGEIPVAGGMAHGKGGSAILVNGERIEQGMVAIGLGGDISVGVAAVNGYETIAGPYQVTAVDEPSVLLELDGRPAIEVYREALGIEGTDRKSAQSKVSREGNVSLLRDGQTYTTYAWVSDDASYFHRFPQRFKVGDEVVFARKNEQKHVTSAATSTKLAEQAIAFGDRPAAVLGFYCIGRTDAIPEQMQQLADAAGPGVPYGVMFCAGEIATQKQNTPDVDTRYYQYTACTLVIGE